MDQALATAPMRWWVLRSTNTGCNHAGSLRGFKAQQMYDEEQPRAMTDAEKATWRGYAVQLAWLVQF